MMNKLGAESIYADFALPSLFASDEATAGISVE
jgi:hypothetical protein